MSFDGGLEVQIMVGKLKNMIKMITVVSFLQVKILFFCA
jgi:hypothetical protein